MFDQNVVDVLNRMEKISDEKSSLNRDLRKLLEPTVENLFDEKDLSGLIKLHANLPDCIFKNTVKQNIESLKKHFLKIGLNEDAIRFANQIIENDAIRLKLNENLQKSLEEIVNDLMDKKDEKGLVELINNLPSCTVRVNNPDLKDGA